LFVQRMSRKTQLSWKCTVTDINIQVNFEEFLAFIDGQVYVQTQRHLKDIEVLVLKGAWEGLSYNAIALRHNYTPQYIRQDAGPKLWRLLSTILNERVGKKNFQTAIKRYWESSLNRDSLPDPFTPIAANLPTSNAPSTSFQSCIEDWGEAFDVSTFYGRVQELQTLSHWLIQDECRMVCLLGMGGIGKTTLAIKLGQQVKDHFDRIVWRSLRHGPTIEILMSDLIYTLSDRADVEDVPITLKDSVARLIHYLRRSRCLIVLDNLESLLQGGIQAGNYSPEYEGYRYVLQSIGEIAHQSCVLLTSREKTREIALLEGQTLPVRSLQISGLNPQEGQDIFTSKGCANADSEALGIIFEHYAGNPLALKMLASSAQELAAGDLLEIIPYLQQGLLQFQNINALLESQFERLTDIEQKILYWLAINRDPTSWSELVTDIAPNALPALFLDAIQSLGRRCLVEWIAHKLCLQPVVMEFVTHRLTQTISGELLSQNVELLHQYPLLKAESQDYIRQAQVQFILRPILETLTLQIGRSPTTETYLKSTLALLKQDNYAQASYAAGNVLNLLCQAQADLTHLDCSHLAIWQAYLVGMNLQYANFTGSDLSKSSFSSTLSASLAVTFSPDGQTFAIGSADHIIRIYSTQGFQELMSLEGHSNWVCSVVFSPDGQTLASGSFDRTIKFWDLSTGNCEKTLQGHTGWVWSVSFSPDGNTLASCQTLASNQPDRNIRLWDTNTGECLQILEGHIGWVWGVAFSPDGSLLASCGDDRSIRLWNSQSGENIAIWEPHQNWVRSVAFSPDGKTLISGSHDGTVRIWDVSTGKCQRILKGHRNLVTSVTFLPASSHPETAHELWIASASNDQKLRVWNVTTGQCLRILQGHTSGIWSISAHPQGHMLASAANDCTVRLWNLQTGQPLRTLQGYAAGIKTSAYLPKTQTLITAGDDKIIKFWNLHTGQCTKRLTGHQSWVWCIALSADNTMLASSSSDMTVRIWDVETGQLRRILQGHMNIVMCVAFSPDGHRVVSGSSDQSIRVWHSKTGACLKTIPLNGRVWFVAYSPNGKYVASCHDDSIIRIWDISSGRCFKELQGHTNLVFTVTFSPDGRQLASGSEDGLVKIWSFDSGTCLQTFEGHTTSVWSVQFCSKGQQVVSSSFDQTIRLWDLEQDRCIQVFDAHNGEVWKVIFGPTPETLTSVGQDGLIKLWDLKTQQCIQVLKEDRPYEHMIITDTTGLTSAQQEALKKLGAIAAHPESAENYSNN
jgi:WD40 repeat protein